MRHWHPVEHASTYIRRTEAHASIIKTPTVHFTICSFRSLNGRNFLPASSKPDLVEHGANTAADVEIVWHQCIHVCLGSVRGRWQRQPRRGIHPKVCRIMTVKERESDNQECRLIGHNAYL